MKNTGSAIILLLTLIVFVSSTPAFSGELPDYIRSQLHRNINYEIITERNLNRLDDLKPGKRPIHFIVVQAKPDSFNETHAKKVLDWVNSGGVVWFYDSRLASHFMMENSPYQASKLNCQPHRGGYGTGTIDGINVIASALPLVEHDVANGAQNIQVFLIKVGEDKYSGVSSKTPGVIPLFACDLEKKCAIAMRKHGKGYIIFKPLIWIEVLGGERIQANLMEFSAGYPVPKAEGPIIPQTAFQGKPVKLNRYDSLILSNGDQVIGMILDKRLTLMGGDEKLEEPVENIESVTFSDTGDRMKLRNGKDVFGFFMALGLDFKTITGKKVTLDKKKLRSIHFNVGNDKSNSLKKEKNLK